MYRSTKAIGFTAVCASAVLAVAPATGALAGTSTIGVTSVSPGFWLSDQSMPVAYTVTSLRSAGKCGPLAITVSWNSSGDKVHHRTIHPGWLNVQAGTISIPGSTIWPGTLRYRVTAKQRCSDGDHADRARIGQAPTTGWFKATIK